MTRSPWTPDAERRYSRSVIRRAKRSCQPALRAYGRWLEEERGLCPGSVTVRLGSARTFLEALVRDGPSAAKRLRRLSAEEVEEFFVNYGQNCGYGARRSMQAALRLLLEFSASRGWTAAELRQSVPSLRVYRLSSLPRGLKEPGVREVLRSVKQNGSARDRAIILLLACYGVRRGQICALRLEDVDWRERQIVFRAHKGGKPVVHSLAPAAAQALGHYLRHERPAAEAEHVFLRSLAPHLPLGPAAVTELVRARLRTCGLTSVPQGPHALRHAFAERMLRSGHSLKVIADLLGHRSLVATSTYAKVDRPRLLEVACEWPESPVLS